MTHAKKPKIAAVIAVLAFSVGVGAANFAEIERSRGPLITCGIAAPPAPNSVDSEPALLACGGYSAGMRIYSSAAGRSTVFTSHGAEQANKRNVNVEHILDGGKVKRQNGMIFISLGGYQVRIASSDGAIVTVVKL